ncbi:hypothetical protein A3752_07680 [Oleiphilus sp. HI0081]|nr:hypothetical protein A3729_12755 [Oleiphilus sp. HI0043]KZY46133.1 hypothetical protein A3732_07975 [Oleiphilus sp. HI0050]KZY59325.1 hypothetical protein A3735_15675 [Oleiphilus sp. HI0061]KZY77997.1 hypothetical protein A3740_09015 [Oleiphilus sp. HI0068]KZY80478.1 hypothetical protein A3741_05535 [Oleiphilus sp. HI0069]KZZ15247.1 hypothetical protein A3749_05195 [Oleiphilus sp. HI0078]KZZ21957.1 hypothetical protein A3752_07680 [Oleiphilus sp. HI0081]KZZ30499.1 hypothetical protein A37
MHQRMKFLSLILLSTLFVSSTLTAGEREQAKRIHDRIAGVPPTASVLDSMAADILAGEASNAAYTAMEHTAFYDVTLKNLAAPWTNEAMSSFVPFNDYMATVIGLVRDDADFRSVLYSDVLYVGNSSLGLPNPSISSNAHYEALEDGGHSLKEYLIASTQSEQYNIPSAAAAGIMTTRASAHAFMKDGTNRALFRFTVLNHLCNDMEQLNDTSLPPDRVRQDVSRSPGGDSRIFLNSCVGCHNGMDPLTQAFAYYNYDYNVENDPEGLNGQMVYNQEGMTDASTGSRVQAKYHINANNFEFGYITPDDSWENYWRSGRNQLLGWDSTLPGSGNGAASMAQELAHSEAFAECQVKKVFQNVCLREPSDAADRAEVASMVTSFKNSGYQLKRVFADSATYCMGE